MLKDDHKSFNHELISRFFDGELEAADRARVDNHIKICPVCRDELDYLQSLSKRVKEHAAGAYRDDAGKIEEKIIEAVRRKESTWWIRGKEALFSKRFLIPAGAATCFLLIFFTIFYNPASSGPSAMITSISGSGQVIVMETPLTHQTILWFSEKG